MRRRARRAPSISTTEHFAGALALRAKTAELRKGSVLRGQRIRRQDFGAGAITCTSGIISVYGVNGWTEGDVPSEDCQKAVTMQPKATAK
jgi:hypothetical protein